MSKEQSLIDITIHANTGSQIIQGINELYEVATGKISAPHTPDNVSVTAHIPKKEETGRTHGGEVDDSKPAKTTDDQAADSQAVTLIDIKTLMRKVLATGKKAEARVILDKYGVKGVSSLEEKDYAPVQEELSKLLEG